MHIPDGFLGPQTWLASYAVMIPLWALAAKQTKKTLKSKYIPTLAIGSAFSFAVMMFNVPIPGGSTGHAIGATLLSLIFGPWASALIISIALAIQALIFGDGGITSYAVNCLIMGFATSFTGYYTYMLLTKFFPNELKAKMLASGTAGYVSLVIASLLAGTVLGIQPILNPPVNGMQSYFPYSLKVSIYAMLIEHLLVFGWVESFITALSYGFLLKENSPVLNLMKEDTSLEIS